MIFIPQTHRLPGEKLESALSKYEKMSLMKIVFLTSMKTQTDLIFKN